MPVEIERKFLVADSSWRADVRRSSEILQGYFPKREGHSLRIRLIDGTAVLSLKGKRDGIARKEYQYLIPVGEAQEMLADFCAGRLVHKIRHYIPAGSLLWEVDEYLDANAGLFTAEIELPAVDTPFSRPAWLGEDISELSDMTNEALATWPWTRRER